MGEAVKGKRRKVFIIAEAGSNWKAGGVSADLQRAKNLINAAVEAGADAVKFQTFRAETVYAPNAGTSGYLSLRGIKRPIWELFKELSMPYSMVPILAGHCRKRNIEFMSSAFSPEDFKVVNPYVRRHKIASYEITHPHLLVLAAKSKKPLILSTGAATHEEIRWAVQLFKKNDGREICLMQCTAKYPAPIQSLNLRAIQELGKRYNVPAGLSDHSSEPVTGPVAAVALGARIIEKHFTLDRGLKGPDHRFALEPLELKAMVRAIRDCEKALGDGKKRVLPEERELRDFAQRGLQALKNIKKGEKFIEGENIGILRPGKQKKGLHPRFLEKLRGKRSQKFIPAGMGIVFSDLKKG